MSLKSKVSFMILAAVATGSLHSAFAEIEKKLTTANVKAMEDKCHDGDGSTCLKYATYVGEDLNQWRKYHLVISYGCIKKSNEECCRQLREDYQEGVELEKKCTNENDRESCFTYGLGEIYMFGERDLGLKYIKKACTLKQPKACLFLEKSSWGASVRG